MLATLEKIDVENTNYDAAPTPGGSNVLDLPKDVQQSLDRILYYFRDNAMKPVINTSGDPLTICSTLSKQIQSNLPRHLEGDAKRFLNYMISQIVAYCRDHKANYLNLDFTFERESRGGAF